MIEANRSRYGARHHTRYRVRIDVFRILADLRHAGLTDDEVGARVGVPRRTVTGWKSGAEPRLNDGIALVRLWSVITGKASGPAALLIEALPLEELAGFRRGR